MEKTAFESLSRGLSWFKNVIVSLTNLCQGQLKISPENAKITHKTTQPETKKLPKDIFWRHAVSSYTPQSLAIKFLQCYLIGIIVFRLY